MSFACAAAPGRPMEQDNIVWSGIVPTWAQGLTGCLYKLSSVASGFSRQRILLCSLIPRWEASCSRILPSSLSFALVLVGRLKLFF